MKSIYSILMNKIIMYQSKIIKGKYCQWNLIKDRRLIRIIINNKIFMILNDLMLIILVMRKIIWKWSKIRKNLFKRKIQLILTSNNLNHMKIHFRIEMSTKKLKILIMNKFQCWSNTKVIDLANNNIQ